MIPKDIFIGPLVRRAQDDQIVICLATFRPFQLRFSVKEDLANAWLGHDDVPLTVEVSPNLFFYFARITPLKGKFPTGRLLAYSIAVVENGVPDYTLFEAIVKQDGLAYGLRELPTLFLQKSRGRLNVLYGSCRKIHDTDGGKSDALRMGDTLVSETFDDPDRRPAILCLGGDQIYADDVHKVAMSEVLALAALIEVARPEKLPGSVKLPGIGRRKDFVTNLAGFTCGQGGVTPGKGDNHLVTFAEYLAMYGLMWNRNNWVSPKGELEHFTSDLPYVRRLLANIPTYMAFDDHDVTDDWNLCLNWRQTVERYKLGRRIVANALMAFWLAQGYGNDPSSYPSPKDFEIAHMIRNRHANYEIVETFFWPGEKSADLDQWEFATPTSPFLYFLDTRTQRGAKDGERRNDNDAPAYLKSPASWNVTLERLQRLLREQDENLPLVLVAAAPVFGFALIDNLQRAVSKVLGPYAYDLESWSANPAHLRLFLRMMGDSNVVVLSGDVHYGFTSTVRSTVFDDRTLREELRLLPKGVTLPKMPVGATPTYEALWTAQFLQLTSSALKNFADILHAPASFTTMENATILTEDGEVRRGTLVGKDFSIDVTINSGPGGGRPTTVKKTKEELKPALLIRQRINDAFNSRYIPDHNVGVVSFNDKTVSHYFITSRGRDSERTWDFTNARMWD